MRDLVLAVVLLATSGCGRLRSSGNGNGNLGGSDAGALINQDAHVQHCLATLNGYRAQQSLSSLTLDDRLSQFALTGSQTLEATGSPHGYFLAQGHSGAIWSQGFCSAAGENQTGPGWMVGPDEDATIDQVLKEMMDEGPGGGHYDNIVSPKFVRLGVGLIVAADQKFYLTNDFSSGCN
jgi:hypothetical protein